MLKKRIESFGYAFKGILDLFISQPNAKIHAFAAVCVGLAAWYLGLSTTEWCFLIFAISSVLAAEAMNTALEYLTDLVSPDYHVLAGKAKDAAAGAVLLTAIGAALVGFIIFLPKILLMLA